MLGGGASLGPSFGVVGLAPALDLDWTARRSHRHGTAAWRANEQWHCCRQRPYAVPSAPSAYCRWTSTGTIGNDEVPAVRRTANRTLAALKLCRCMYNPRPTTGRAY